MGRDCRTTRQVVLISTVDRKKEQKLKVADVDLSQAPPLIGA